jgi:hypothetical protein
MGTVPVRFKSLKPKAHFRVSAAEDAARLARSLRDQAAPFQRVLPGRSSSCVEDAMMDSEFLRKKARALELLADSCFDGHAAQRLRELADEFQTKADRDDSSKIPAPYIYSSKARSGGGGGADRH